MWLLWPDTLFYFKSIDDIKVWAIVTLYQSNHIRPTRYPIEAYKLSFQDHMGLVRVWSLVLVLNTKLAFLHYHIPKVCGQQITWSYSALLEPFLTLCCGVPGECTQMWFLVFLALRLSWGHALQYCHNIYTSFISLGCWRTFFPSSVPMNSQWGCICTWESSFMHIQ